jgi:hypothetical protein
VVGFGDELTLYWPDGAFANDRRPTGLDLVMCDGDESAVREILLSRGHEPTADTIAAILKAVGR